MRTVLIGGFAAAAVLASAASTGDDAPAERTAFGLDIRFGDVAITVDPPFGWHVTGRPITAAASPRTAFSAASFSMHPPVRPRSCGPDEVLARMPKGGGLVHVFEYESYRTRSVALSRFPKRPVHFRLPKRTLQPYECMGYSYMLRFRDADRAFQAHIWLDHASPQRRRQVVALLDSMQIEPLPRIEDPYYGWPILTNTAGDSIQRPPGWAALRTFVPRDVKRPRGLFLVSNQSLAGRGTDRVYLGVPGVRTEEVLIHVSERTKGPPSAGFRPLGRDGFNPEPVQDPVTRSWGDAAWWRGFRFEVVVRAAADASEEDVERALLAAASLAVSAARGG